MRGLWLGNFGINGGNSNENVNFKMNLWLEVVVIVWYLVISIRFFLVF